MAIDPVAAVLEVSAASVPAASVPAREFTALFEAEAPRVWRLLRRLGVREADLDDVCQEVFVVVHRRWAEFRGDSTLRTWLTGIALRSALGYRHRRGQREVVPLTEAAEPAAAAEQPAAVEQRQLRARLTRALDGLPSGKREVFVLYELEELPMAEIAGLLEVPVQTCYSRLYAARAQLAAALRRSDERGSR